MLQTVNRIRKALALQNRCLAGDQDFASPQSLVAFALGLTLFAMTLVLNVIALVVVRRYREQYE